MSLAPHTERDLTMTAWTPADLDAISRTPDLYVSPFRDDGITYGTPTQTWALVVDGQVYVRAANGPTSRWYQAAITQGAGRVRVADQDYEVTFAEAPADVDNAIDAAYEDKYPGSSAVPIMQGDGPKSATVVITPR
jgi:hypothetical protein